MANVTNKIKATKPLVGWEIKAGRATQVIAQIKAATSQTANLIDVFNSVGTKVLSLTAAGAWTASGTGNLLLNSGISGADQAGKTVRINSITNIGTANSFIGFQSKPAQGASTAQDIIGAEISPRVNDTFALTGTGSLIGLTVSPILKGTSGNIAGDVRGQQIELTTDDAATRTITGDVVGLRMRAAFSGTISGDMIAISVEKAEAQTNSKQWEYFLRLTGDNALIWRDDYSTEVTTLSGAIKVLVNGADRWIPLYSGAPSV